MSKKRRTFSTDFKKQVVALYENGKSRQDIVREYELTASALDRWIMQFQQSGSFTEKDTLPTWQWGQSLGAVKHYYTEGLTLLFSSSVFKSYVSQCVQNGVQGQTYPCDPYIASINSKVDLLL